MNKILLIKFFHQPQIIKSFTPANWSLLLGQLRTSQLTLYFHHVAGTAGLDEYIPARIKRYIQAEQRKVGYQKQQVSYELNQLDQAFKESAISVTYLKGAAYLIAGLPISNHRLFSDIDILVNKAELDNAENVLKIEGFTSQKTDDYDQAYYRQYMHEIPPMQHIIRGTVIDLHHNILPVCREHPINISLFNDTQTISYHGLHLTVFSPSAMYLHCAIHLFHEGDFDKGLRDLADLAAMYTEFMKTDDSFEQSLLSLASQTQQQKSLYFALKFIAQIFNIELGKNSKSFVENFRQGYRHAQLSDFIFLTILAPYHPSCESRKVKLARLLAYIRGHLLRMPLRLLLPHLCRKFIAQLTTTKDKTPLADHNKIKPDI
ncbi:hypothetical protein DXX93_19735 [Thalassotalea euphylliae]|uniref:Nucleotidyltransferase family protein n=1 Tax=Thalassotalea euphylliae TaxID=1655234 RepID=A0A3E0TV73_9GAMM|nr:nucleotidyltransferase family protein [Thalassotalea euphylliae]REL28576.1 hypothetical protein DXX93_19735 [Thalassotalea euphylliae]